MQIIQNQLSPTVHVYTYICIYRSGAKASVFYCILLFLLQHPPELKCLPGTFYNILIFTNQQIDLQIPPFTKYFDNNDCFNITLKLIVLHYGEYSRLSG